MDEQTISLVQESFAKVVPVKDATAATFYSDLFETAPDVRPYFANANMAEQGSKMMVTLGIIVSGLRDLDRILPVAQNLAIAHIEYGVQPEDYDKVGASLLRAIEHSLGEHYTDDVARAWTTAYDIVSSSMKAAAYK